MNTGLNAMFGSTGAANAAANNAALRPQTASGEPGARFSQMLRDCDLPRSTEPVKPSPDAENSAENSADTRAEKTAATPRSTEGRTETQRQDTRNFAKRASDAAKPGASANANATPAPVAAKTDTAQDTAGETSVTDSDAPADATEPKDVVIALPLASALASGLLPAPTALGKREEKRPAETTDKSDERAHQGGLANTVGRSAASLPGARAPAAEPTTATADLARSFATDLKDATALMTPAVAAAEFKTAAAAARSEPAAIDAMLSAAAAQPGTAHASDVATSPAVTLAQPLYSPAFAPELAARISVWAADGVQQAQLLLNPAEMGPVAVQIVVEGQQAQISFHADQADTRAVLERSLPDLAAALRDAGLTLSGGGVFQQSNGQSDGRAQTGPDSHSSRQASVDSSDTLAQLASRALPPARATRGVVDLYA